MAVLTMIPVVTAADFSWFGNVPSSGEMVTTDPLPEGADCTITAGIIGDSSLWWWDVEKDLQVDVAYFERWDTHEWDSLPQGYSFLQFGTGDHNWVDWGVFKPDHIYTLGGLKGEGVPLHLRILDSLDAHYWNNDCHIPVTIECECEEPEMYDCTPGFWKNHPRSWPAGYDPDDSVDSYFPCVTPQLGDDTLMQALSYTGKAPYGHEKNLLRIAVASLMNSATWDYPYSQSDIMTKVCDWYVPGFNKGLAEELKNDLDYWNNELPCPTCGGNNFCKNWVQEGWLPAP